VSVVEAHKKTVNPMCHSSQNKRLIVDNNNVEKVTTNNNLGNLSHELNSNDSMQTIDVGLDGWITSGIISEQIVVVMILDRIVVDDSAECKNLNQLND